MTTKYLKERAMVFDYKALRLLMGFIAFALPFVVSVLSSTVLSSISASYYTEARDVFVGMLFVVSAFLWAYNGHFPHEGIASKVASIVAILIALFPTSCDPCSTDLVFNLPIEVTSKIHYGAAITLFSILAYFCLGPFRQRTESNEGKRGRRRKIYLVCGWTMVGCMVGAIVAKLALSDETVSELSVTYWAEAIALCAFGFAWMVAGKYFRLFVDVDNEDALRLFRR